jgi:2',5'-phosphodiesterase
MTPESGGYELLTTGSLAANHPEFPTLPSWDSWRPTLRAMKSAYAEAHPEGQEPETTNKAVRLIGKWGAKANAFSGTLDYVFIFSGESASFSVLEVLALPDKAVLEARPSWPTGSIPSDHLEVGATLRYETKR